MRQTFKLKVSDPDLCQLYLQVKDESDLNIDNFIGYCAVPVDCLLMGYRTFEIYDILSNREGDFQFASIFCRVSIQPWVEEVDVDEPVGMAQIGRRGSFLSRRTTTKRQSLPM